MKEIKILDDERLTQFLYFAKEGVSRYPTLTEEDYSELQDACKGSVVCTDNCL